MKNVILLSQFFVVDCLNNQLLEEQSRDSLWEILLYQNLSRAMFGKGERGHLGLNWAVGADGGWRKAPRMRKILRLMCFLVVQLFPYYSVSLICFHGTASCKREAKSSDKEPVGVCGVRKIADKCPKSCICWKCSKWLIFREYFFLV